MNSDIINCTFEFVGGILTWMNVKRVYQDKGYAGIYAPAVVLFTSWGLWNLWYYPSLNQWWSFVGGLNVFLANISWLGIMYYFGRKR